MSHSRKSQKSEKIGTPRKLCTDSSAKSNLIHYQLSNNLFIKSGWTILPVDRTVRKIVRYQAQASKPRVNWRERYKEKSYYDNGTILWNPRKDGTAEIFYPNGKTALKISRPTGRAYDIYTVFTPGDKDAFGLSRGSLILAVFDTMGEGVVFGEDGRTRLTYNQNGGVYLDNPTGVPFTWFWNNYQGKSVSFNLYSEVSVAHLVDDLRDTNQTSRTKSPKSGKTEDNKKQDESNTNEVTDNFSKVKLQPIKDRRMDILAPVKTICLKLNGYLSLRILDRRNVSLRFFAGNKSVRIELGVELNPRKELFSYFVDSSNWVQEMLKCRFIEKPPEIIGPKSSLQEISREYEKLKKTVSKNKKIRSKYNNHVYKMGSYDDK
ncbi:uncharacterized protein LOC107270464 isoform X2 [Cephus cinctus]|uniref:Uncharacterized protein LOC107270464 isoform X2 n=1 Tax=Cephus cinctus TaxID=211228 RepID=A0AAJ7RNA5_CEPCN|nr:uncharacterized protein LOC107270464 isoform X2 [Cephus cinctus]